MPHLGNNYSYKTAHQRMLKSILREQQVEAEQKKMNQIQQAKAPEEDKNQKFYGLQKKKSDEQKQKIATKEAVRDYYMGILLTKLYEASCPVDIMGDDMALVRKNIVNNFIKENGSFNIKNNMKRQSFALKSMCEAEEIAELDTEAKNKEVIHEEEPEEIKNNIKAFIPGETESEFCDALDNEDNAEETTDIGDHVRTYVSNSVEKFIIDNIEDKQKIKDVMTNVQDKVSAINTANDELDSELKEAAIKTSKQKIHKIEQRKKTFFEQMVRSVAKAAINTKNKHLITESGNIDMPKVVKVSEAMLTMMVLAESIGFEFDEQSMYSQFE